MKKKIKDKIEKMGIIVRKPIPTTIPTDGIICVM